MKNRLALPLLLLTILALIMGMTGGLQRLGWGMPLSIPALTLGHGPLMICGFFASLIAIERAVALARGWGWAAPALIATGSLCSTLWPAQGLVLLVTGSALLAVTTFALYQLQKSLFNALLGVAALCLLVGDIVWWITGTVWAAMAWWMLFLLLTITAERLELTRLLPRQRHSQLLLLLVIALLAAGAVLVMIGHPHVFGLALVALGLWLLRYDIARRNLRMSKLPRYIAVCLCAGYVWLLVAGLLLIANSGPLEPGAATYDAVLHAVFLGFVFSMVFGHAPIIIPAITRLRLQFHPLFYLPLALLHASLAVRIVADLAGNQPWRLAGGSGNVLAIVLFIAAILASVQLARNQPLTQRR